MLRLDDSPAKVDPAVAGASATQASSWGESFKPYSSLHLVATLVCAAIVVVFIIIARRSPRHAHAARLVYGWFALLLWLGANIYWCIPPQLSPAQSLPLHLCDVAGVIAPIALLTRAHWARVIMYFWGLVLSSQGFLQPTLRAGPATLEFWLFWATHLVIVGTPIFLMATRQLRLVRRDLYLTFAISCLYFVVMFFFDWATGYNYGYIGPKLPAQGGDMLRVLGPWPIRPFMILLVGFAAFVVAYLPWEFVARKQRPTLPSACPHCGYDHAGLAVDAPCPECGKLPSDSPARP